MKTVIGLLLGLGIASAASADTGRLPEVRTVDRVDLQRYLGTWYEIASFPQRFQKGCTATTATYSLKPNGEINVLNSCRKGSLQGEEDSSQGRARVTDKNSNAKLEVSFFWPFWGDYWIIDLGPNYEYAVVGHPSRDYLWILSRTPKMDPELYSRILERVRSQHFDTSRLVPTPQP
jgi:apolipoprotein D and lipocalin family protein